MKAVLMFSKSLLIKFSAFDIFRGMVPIMSSQTGHVFRVSSTIPLAKKPRLTPVNVADLAQISGTQPQ